MKDTIIVTGGTSGLGYELALSLHSMGYKIATVSRNANKLNELKNQLKDDLVFYQGDISDETFVNGFIYDLCQKETVCGLINNACEGFFAPPTQIHDEAIEKSFKGVKGMMLISAALLREKAEKNLKIINILSTAALKGKKMEAAYCMAKWAQRGYTESLKDAYQDSTVEVYGVYVGGMDSDFWKKSRDYISEEKQKTFMDPAEIALQIANGYFKDGVKEDIIIKRN